MTDSGFRLDVQGLRGLALVLVLGTHADIPFMQGGFVGLDVFFVLSGFLITGLILDEIRRTGRVSLLRFYARRARRLLPMAVTVLAVVLVGAWLTLDSVRTYEVSGDAIAAALYFVNWHFIAKSVDYFHFDDPAVSPLQHYWSLSVEEQFYVVWPLLIVGLLWAARRSGWSAKALLWAATLSLGVASLVFSIAWSPAHPQAAYLSTLTRVWELALGCCLALGLPRAIRLPRAASFALAGGALVVLVWTAAALDQARPYPGAVGLLPTLAAAAVIVAGTATVASAPIRVLSTAPLQYLGKISYAWYLWHWPALTFAAASLGELTTAQKIAVTLLSWIPTAISHYLIEEPFRRSRSLSRRPRGALALGAVCTASAVGLGGWLTVSQTAIETASAGEVLGAQVVVAGDRTLQQRAERIRPDPRRAKRDRGPAFAHCHVKQLTHTTSPDAECVFGDPESDTRVVNLGDSHGLMYSPPLIELARKHGWRLVNLTRSACTVADVEYKRRCDAWREDALGRIEREQPDLVVVSHATDPGERYAVVRDGVRLTRAASEPYLQEGLERTLRRLAATGAKVVVIRDMARAPLDVVGCVNDRPHDLAACSFVPHRSKARAFDARAARNVEGVRLVDPLPVLCPKGRCPAVIGNALVYMDAYHLTATFANTLAPWLERQLPRPK